MSKAQAESVIRNIIREIAEECVARGHKVSETLVAFMVKAVVLDPANGFNVDRTLTKSDVRQLIEVCISRLLDAESPSLETAKMQVYFDMNYTSRKEFIDEHKKVLESRLSPLARELTDSRARTKDELEALYQKIVSFVLLRSGLGSPTIIAVVREATAALQSVFPQMELGTFMSLSKKDKERQLVELTLITTGIRLFNKESKKGGEGIDDLPNILKEAIPSTLENLKMLIKDVDSECHIQAAILEDAETKSYLRSMNKLQLFADAHASSRQLQLLLNILEADIMISRKHVDDLSIQYVARTNSLKETISSRSAVPTAQVYPQFINLAYVWSSFQNEMVLLSVLSNIASGVEQFRQVTQTVFPRELLDDMAGEISIKSDKDRLIEIEDKQEEIVKIKIFNKEIDVLFSDTTKDFNSLPIQYKGFCGYSFATADGILIPGNKSLGILVYRGNFYAFSNLQAVYEFADNPEDYLSIIVDKAKRSPELIQLLELHKLFAVSSPYTKSVGQGSILKGPVTRCDAGTQTDTHIMQPNIVRSYEWNEWDLRRKALKLANLRTKLTHATQTDMSHFKRDNTTQVYLHKLVETQTKQDGYSSVPKPSVFISGLRGCESTQTISHKVDLTLDVKDG